MLRAIRKRNFIQLPQRLMDDDHDLQVFAAACFCLGFGCLAWLMGLTAATGSFAAGIFIGRTRAFQWLDGVMRPFKVFFTALFFVSVGMQLDLAWMGGHWLWFGGATGLVILANTLLSMFIFKALGYPWRQSLYAGALLSQIGEFGLIACSMAFHMGLVTQESYRAGIALTAVSLLTSAGWMPLIRRHCMPASCLEVTESDCHNFRPQSGYK